MLLVVTGLVLFANSMFKSIVGDCSGAGSDLLEPRDGPSWSDEHQWSPLSFAHKHNFPKHVCSGPGKPPYC